MGNSKIFTPPKGEQDEHAYHTSMEKKVRAALTPFQEYINNQATASIFLFLCTITALAWASIPTISGLYQKFVNTSLGFHLSHFVFEKSLRFWINDVLLALFFFFVGLEIKREFLVGELTNHKRAIFVLFAGLGGMVIPAGLYLLINMNSTTQFAWGIPMATDTAFALGILSCFKQKIPKGLFTFLAALAIIDDIGAILAIAIFYTSHLNTVMLFLASILCGVLLFMNYAGFRKPFVYITIGVLIWASLEAAGIHGTVSGILVAFLIPARPQKGPKHFISKTRELLNYFEKRKEKNPLILEDQQQHVVLEKVQEVAQEATTPLQRWESKLELPIALLVLPLFALVNAGIPMNLHLLGDVFIQPVSLGILIGLVIGKPLGVLLFSRAALWFRLGTLPENTNFYHIFSVAMLTGIGFTMSIFISDLSFGKQEHFLLLSKAAILISSLFAGIFGSILLTIVARKSSKIKTESEAVTTGN